MSVFFQNVLAGAVGGLLAVILVVSFLLAALYFADNKTTNLED